MEKVISILLAGVFLLTHLGVHVESHYCMDRLTHMDWFSTSQHADDEKCACGMEKDLAAGCCEDVAIHATNEYHGIGQTTLSLAKTYASILQVFGFSSFRVEPKVLASAKGFVYQKTKPPPQWYQTWQVTKLLI